MKRRFMGKNVYFYFYYPIFLHPQIMIENIALILVILLVPIAFIIGRKTKNTLQDHQELIHKQAENSFLIQQIAQLNSDKDNLEEQADIYRIDNQELIATLSIAQTKLEALQNELLHKQEQEQNLIEQNKLAFEVMANKILEEKTQKFTAQNKDNIQSLLDPLQQKIHLFEQKVELTHKESIDHHAALRQQIIGLMQLNTQMSEQTLNLTRALKGDNKTQGNWGEMILESVLEKSGLEKGREYFTQKNFTNENGQKFQPDVVIELPDQRHMIIDAKVSLSAYERFVNEVDTTIQKQHLNEHMQSIRRHISGLSEKNYAELYKGTSPDFVLLFIPIETAFSVAINSDNSIYNYAFDKNIVIVTPSTLLATLRTIESMWSHKKQQENAFEIAKNAGLLYDKFVGLTQDLTKIGQRIDQTKHEYDAAFNKLSIGKGNLIVSVEKLKEMGAKAKKSLDTQLIDKAQNNTLNQ